MTRKSTQRRSKFSVAQPEIAFCGQIARQNGLWTQPENLQLIYEWKTKSKKRQKDHVHNFKPKAPWDKFKSRVTNSLNVVMLNQIYVEQSKI